VPPTRDDLALMKRYSELRKWWDELVDRCSASPGNLALKRMRDHAGDRIDDLKASLGEPDQSDPLCCRRYSRLHMPAFAVSGCRWYELRERTGT
jgi:hypothetical protein